MVNSLQFCWVVVIKVLHGQDAWYLSTNPWILLLLPPLALDLQTLQMLVWEKSKETADWIHILLQHAVLWCFRNTCVNPPTVRTVHSIWKFAWPVTITSKRENLGITFMCFAWELEQYYFQSGHSMANINQKLLKWCWSKMPYQCDVSMGDHYRASRMLQYHVSHWFPCFHTS